MDPKKYRCWIIVRDHIAEPEISSALLNSKLTIAAAASDGRVCADDHLKDAACYMLAYNITSFLETPLKVEEVINKSLKKIKVMGTIVTESSNCVWRPGLQKVEQNISIVCFNNTKLEK